MKNINKKTNLILKIIGIFVFIPFVVLYPFGNLYHATTHDYHLKKTLEERWNIVLPDNITIEYHTEPTETFNGDGFYLTVFKLKTTPSDFIKDFSREKDINFEKSVNDELDFCKNSTVIDDVYIPEWENNYYWKVIEDSDDTLYMIYYPNSLKLIFCESIF